MLLLFTASTRSAARSRVSTRAFTLVELLVVMAIIGVLVALIVPVLRGPLDGMNLSGSTENLVGQFALARQTAMSRNLSVELRIYKTDNGSGRMDWGTTAVVIPALVSGRASDEFVGTPSSLSGNVIIDPGASTQGGGTVQYANAFSTLLMTGLNNNVAPTVTSPNPAAPWTAQETSSAAPPALRRSPALNYVAFRFQPDGSTDLPQITSDGQQAYRWSLSLRNYNAPAAANSAYPATNFVTLVIDPATGRIIVYRP